MQQVVSSAAVVPSGRWLRITSRARLESPTLREWLLTAIGAGLLILSFPNFDTSAGVDRLSFRSSWLLHVVHLPAERSFSAGHSEQSSSMSPVTGSPTR